MRLLFYRKSKLNRTKPKTQELLGANFLCELVLPALSLSKGAKSKGLCYVPGGQFFFLCLAPELRLGGLFLLLAPGIVGGGILSAPARGHPNEGKALTWLAP